MLSNLEEDLINNFNACDRCLKRFVKKPDKTLLKKSEKNRKNCKLCGGLLNDVRIQKSVFMKINAYKCRTFKLGVRLPQSLEKLENDIALKYGIVDYITLRKAVKQRISNYLKRKLGLKIANSPDLSIIVEIGEYENMIYINEKRAIYRINFIKKRGARVFAEKCEECNGNGCEACRWTGKKKDESFESYLIYDLPQKLKASQPEIIWPIKDMPELEFYGNGFPVYVIFKSIKERSSAPLLIDFDINKEVKIVSFYEIKGHLSLNKPFLLEGDLCIKFRTGCDAAKIEKLYKLERINIEGKNKTKTWVKSVKIRRFFKKNDYCCIDGEFESGINFYNLLGIREGIKDKHILNKPFEKNEIEAFLLDLRRASLPD
jgi:hypothetical protein